MWLRRVGIEEEIARAAREVLSERWTLMDLRSLDTADPRAHPAWSAIEEMGWLELLVPENLGGLGLGAVEAGAIFEESGRALFPGPLFGSMVVGARCRRRGLVEAQETVGFAYADPSSEGQPAWQTARWLDGRLTGTKHLVEFADAADTFVVLASGADGSGPLVVVVDAADASVEVELLPTIDAACRVANIRLTQTPGEVLASGDEAALWVDEVRSLAQCLYASRLLGVCDRLLEIAVDHSQTREQFGRPVGSFQAVQHLLADLKVATATARSACYVSQASLAESTRDAGRRATVAKGYASTVGRRVAEGALQVLGGIGFTAEHDLHLYYKHALSLQGLWGDERHHQERLARGLVERIRSEHVDASSLN